MNTTNFALRHIGPRKMDQEQMLKTIGVDSIDQLIYETVPDDILLKKELNLDQAMSEQEYLVHINELSKKNKNLIDRFCAAFFSFFFYEIVSSATSFQ